MPPRGDTGGTTKVRGKLPGRQFDVSRMEFENLYGEVTELLRGIRRIEADLRRLTDRLARLERRSSK